MTGPEVTAAPTVAAWTRATFGGWVLGVLLVVALIVVADVVGLGGSQFPVGLGLGSGVGLLQARALAPPGATRGRWARASAAGLTLPCLANDIAAALAAQRLYALPVAIAIGGLLAGLAQARLLQPRSPHTRWWIAVSAAGWSLAAATILVGDRVPLQPAGVRGAVLYLTIVLAGGLLLGVAGGIGLRAVQRGSGDR